MKIHKNIVFLKLEVKVPNGEFMNIYIIMVDLLHKLVDTAASLRH